jgi:soluble lytic murein transglycosylase-like protein
MRSFVLATLSSIVFAICFTHPALAKKQKKDGLAERSQPCPLDESLRVANGQALSRYSILANCGSKIIVAPASDQEERATIRIVPQTWESDDSTNDAVINRSNVATTIAANQTPNDILSLRPATYTTPFDQTIHAVAQRHRVDPLLLHAVIRQESGYRQSIKSHAGAVGLMQIMPATGATLGLATPDLLVPESNIDAGARLLKKLYRKYDGNFNLVLAAYNAGEGAVQKYGNKIPPYTETQNYVKRVLAHYDRLVTDAVGPGAGR